MSEEVIGFSVRHKRRALPLACPSASTYVLGLTDVFGYISTQEAIEFIEGQVVTAKKDDSYDKCEIKWSPKINCEIK